MRATKDLHNFIRQTQHRIGNNAISLLCVIALSFGACPTSVAQNQSTESTQNTKTEDPANTDVSETDAVTNDASTQTPNANDGAKTIKRSAPDTLNTQIQLLKAQYPPRDLINLETANGAFTALWKKDQSGEALGAILLVPSNGQTANWPNTIDVLRNELPKHGWSTLSIDIAQSTQKNDSQAIEQRNLERIRAAISFLHEKGQYNIVLAGYGISCSLIVEYATQGDAPGMQRAIKSTQTTALKRPVRALMLISPHSQNGERLSEKIGDFPFKEMPFLDIVFGSHYLDTFDSKERQSNARAANIAHYLQTKSLEPSTNGKVFGNNNRLSRRVRGFLDTHAKGVEIGRR